MATHTQLGVATADVRSGRRPERFRVTEVPAKGVPFQPRVLAPQGCQARLGEPASLVLGNGVRFLNPAQAAGNAELIVNGKYLRIAKVCRPFAPPRTIG
jgi:hypothetical protein